MANINPALQAIGNAGPFYCPVCVKDFVYPNGPISHCKNLHGKVAKKCIVCGVECIDFPSLVQHFRTHVQNLIGIECRFCGHFCETFESLVQHFRDHLRKKNI